MNILPWISVLIAFIGNSLIGLITLQNNPKSATNRIFAIFSFLFALYLICNQISTIQTDDLSTLFWIRIVMIIAPLIVLSFFILVNTFPKNKINLTPKKLLLSIIITLLIIVLDASPYVFTNVIPGTNQPTPGPAIIAFIIYNFSFLGISIFILIKKYKASIGIEKSQLRLFLLGATSMFSLILLSNVVLVIFLNISNFVVLVPLYTLIFVGSISYAIIKHKFLDIGALVVRTVTYTIIVLLISIVLSLSINILGLFTLNITHTTTELITLIILTSVFALTFERVRKLIEKNTDKLLFKDKYDTQTLLYNMSVIMASTLRLEDLTHQLLNELTHQIKITTGAFILTEKDKIYNVSHLGYKQTPEFDEVKILKLTSIKSVLAYEDINDPEIQNIYKEFGFSIVTALITEGNHLGIIALGQKQSGDIYSNDDIHVLEIISPEAAVAIQNAKAYEEIHRFNITLKDEIDSATLDLQKANSKLEELDKLKDDFVSLASHELRTPMTAIKSYSWLVMNEKAGPIEPKAKEYISRVFDSTERLIHLVNEMLDISRIESGRTKITKAPCDMVKLAQDVETEFAARAADAKLTLKLEHEQPEMVVSADREKIHQVLENLIGNAFKFTPPDGTITIKLAYKDDMLHVSIIDTGKGIAPEDIERLFQKFGRSEKSLVVSTVKGSGLGLYICKQYVELHGGTIGVESVLDQGSTFYFTLPINPPSDATESQKA